MSYRIQPAVKRGLCKRFVAETMVNYGKGDELVSPVGPARHPIAPSWFQSPHNIQPVARDAHFGDNKEAGTRPVFSHFLASGKDCLRMVVLGTLSYLTCLSLLFSSQGNPKTCRKLSKWFSFYPFGLCSTRAPSRGARRLFLGQVALTEETDNTHGVECVLVAFHCCDEDGGQKQAGVERVYYILKDRVHQQGSQGNNSKQEPVGRNCMQQRL